MNVNTYGGGKFAIYSRKSKLTEKGESIENQVEMCKMLLKQKYENIDLERDIIVYEDEGFSGGTINRPQFKKMMDDARRKKFAVIVCYRLDRLSRNISDFSKLIDELSGLNIEFISVKEKFETDTPMGRAMMYIASVFSQLEREVIAERIRDNMLELAKTGRWLGGVTPTGYESKSIEKVNVNGKNKKVFMLEQIPDEVQKIKMIFEKYIELKSLTKLETYLLKNNIKTKFGKVYTRYTLKTILRNIVYAQNDEVLYRYLVDNDVDFFADRKDFDGNFGMMAYNKTMQRGNVTNRFNGIKDWIIAIGKHQGVISGEDYVTVQHLLKANESMRYKKGICTESLLSGMIVCGECGAYMRPKASTREYSDGKRRFYYMCEMKDKSRKANCQSVNVDGNLADKILTDVIKELLQPNSLLCEELDKISKSFDGIKKDVKEREKVLNNKLNKNKLEIGNLIEKLKYLDNDLISEVTNEIRKLKEDNEKIKIELELNENNYRNGFENENYTNLMLNIIEEYRNSFEDMDYKAKRELIKLLVSSVETKGKDIIIHLLGSDKAIDNTILFPKSYDCK